MILLLIAVLLETSRASSDELEVDCSECGTFEKAGVPCLSNGETGYKYVRDVSGCDDVVCEAEVCDVSRQCRGTVIKSICDENCLQKTHVFAKNYQGVCTMSERMAGCEGGNCTMYYPTVLPTTTPLQTVNCSSTCGKWYHVGLCRGYQQPSEGRNLWRSTASRHCPDHDCGEFGCDPTHLFKKDQSNNNCTGTFVESLCDEDCKQKYRLWKLDGYTCTDTVYYFPCDTREGCATLPDALQLL